MSADLTFDEYVIAMRKTLLSSVEIPLCLRCGMLDLSVHPDPVRDCVSFYLRYRDRGGQFSFVSPDYFPCGRLPWIRDVLVSLLAGAERHYELMFSA